MQAIEEPTSSNIPIQQPIITLYRRYEETRTDSGNLSDTWSFSNDTDYIQFKPYINLYEKYINYDIEASYNTLKIDNHIDDHVHIHEYQFVVFPGYESVSASGYECNFNDLSTHVKGTIPNIIIDDTSHTIDSLRRSVRMYISFMDNTYMDNTGIIVIKNVPIQKYGDYNQFIPDNFRDHIIVLTNNTQGSSEIAILINSTFSDTTSNRTLKDSTPRFIPHCTQYA